LLVLFFRLKKVFNIFTRRYMKAIILKGPNQPFSIESVEQPQPAGGQVLVKLKAASINRRDVWIKQGNYPRLQYPSIMGSDGAGIVSAVGQGVDSKWIGRDVLINPSLYWGDQRAGQGPDFQILGIPSQGTFAGYICVPASNIYNIPDGYDYEKAAALPLAGLTAHRALFYRGDLKSGQTILITGIGGGVAGFLLGFAVRAGARVYVSSSSAEKLAKAASYGALDGVNYKEDGWIDQLKEWAPNGFDLIVDSAGGPDFPALIDLLKNGGKIVNFGRTAGPIPEMSPALLFYKQASILGTTMGSPADFESMLEFIEEYNMRPVIDAICDLENAEEAFGHVEKSAQFGKVVCRISDHFAF
jgi:zinc-binding alcohol dehydrogenase/oxidoreductase